MFALFAMQSGLVRSDKPHIKVAVFTMVFFVGTILFSFRSRVVSAVVALVAFVASLLLGNPAFYPSVIRYHYAQVRRPMTQCPKGFREFDRGCFPTRFGEMLYSVSRYLEERNGARDSIAVFPYQTMFGVASRRNAAGGVMQSYLVSGPHLSQLDIAGFERAAAPVGLYLPDKNLSHISGTILVFPLTEYPTSRAARRSGCGSSAIIVRSKRCFPESWACGRTTHVLQRFRCRRNRLALRPRLIPFVHPSQPWSLACPRGR